MVKFTGISINEEKTELSDLHENEKKKLTDEINKLKAEISELNNTIENSKKEAIIQSTKKEKDNYIENEKISIVAEPVTKYSDDYDSKSLSELKEIAKRKGIKNLKNYTKAKKHELISLIRQQKSNTLNL